MEDNIIKYSTDWISQVPEFIIHHIMSFLKSPKDRVRMSVLSKTWFALTASFPILDFDIWQFVEVINAFGRVAYGRDKFFKYVEYTTSRFCQQTAISAHTFKLNGVPLYSTEIDIVDRCLGFICMKGVQVLVTDFNPMFAGCKTTYCLSNSFLSASSLTSLTLAHCELPSSLMLNPVKFKSLKLLRLEYLDLDNEVIKYLTNNCPLLEEFIIRLCYGFKRFCVYGLQNLQKVEINCGVEIIDIEAPNLSDVFVFNSKSEAPHMQLASCKKLTTLTYYALSHMKSEVFSDFLSDVPFIQNLILGLPHNCKILKLSSSSLRKLVLLTTLNLEEIDISTPNLLLFEYHFPKNLPVLVLRESLQLKAQIAVYSQDYVGGLLFQKLKQFLDTKNGFKVLKLHLSSRDFFNVEILKGIRSPQYELEHVELQLTNIGGLSAIKAVVDAVLWCCCPRSLNLTSWFHNIDSAERNQAVKFTYEKLLQQEHNGQIIIRMVLSSSSKAEKHFSDLNSLLIALPHIGQEHAITFTKEEAVPEKAG